MSIKMSYFYFISPCMQFLLDKDTEEFHIKLKNNGHYCRAYQDNTQKYLWDTIEEYITDKWKDALLSHGSDYEDSGMYVWIHIKKEKKNDSIEKIITELNEWFDTELKVFMIPKLISIICKNLESNTQYLSDALIEYQSKHGKYVTQQTMNTYFQDIKRNHMTKSNPYDEWSD